MSIQVRFQYVPGIESTRPRIAVRFPAAPGATVVTVTDLATNLNVAVTGGATVADLNDAQTIHYDAADIAGLDLEAVGSKQLLIHFTPAVGDPEQALLDILPPDSIADLYDGAVWMRATAPGGGTVRGVDATKFNPTSDIDNALDVLDDLGLSTIRVYFDGTNEIDFVGDVSELVIEGVSGFPLLTFDAGKGTDLSGTTIRRCAIEGDIGEITFNLILENCRTNDEFSFEGLIFARECFFGHTVFHGAAKFAQVLAATDCEFVPIVASLGDPLDIDMQDNEAIILLTGMRGRVRVLNNTSTAGIGQLISLRAGAKFIVDASSDGDSEYMISGHGLVLDETVAGANIDHEAVVDETGVGNHVLIDQREYAQDGPNQLQIKCRRSTFTNEADRAAAAIVGAALVPPFVEGRHISAVKTQYIETTPGANPGEALIHSVRIFTAEAPP